MFGAISADILLDLYQQEYGLQLDFFDEFPPCIYISKDKLTSVTTGYSWNSNSFVSSQDHPAFAELREHLAQKGFIEIERGWINGDRVKKPFYLNNMYFDTGDKFSCAAALGVTYKIALQNSNCKPQLGGVSDKPLEREEHAENTKKDFQENSDLFESLRINTK